MGTRVERIYWLFVLLTLACFVTGVVTNLFIFFVTGIAFLLIVTIMTFVIDARRRFARVEEIRSYWDEKTLVHEAEMFLLQVEFARQGAFLCPVCFMVSYNPNALENGYCGKCHDFTGTQRPDAPEI